MRVTVRGDTPVNIEACPRQINIFLCSETPAALSDNNPGLSSKGVTEFM